MDLTGRLLLRALPYMKTSALKIRVSDVSTPMRPHGATKVLKSFCDKVDHPRSHEQYRQAPIKHANETGWRINSKNGYSWLFYLPLRRSCLLIIHSIHSIQYAWWFKSVTAGLPTSITATPMSRLSLLPYFEESNVLDTFRRSCGTPLIEEGI